MPGDDIGFSRSSAPITPAPIPPQTGSVKGAPSSATASSLAVEHTPLAASSGLGMSALGTMAGLPPLPQSSLSGIGLTVALQNVVRNLRLNQEQSDSSQVKAQNQELQQEHAKNIKKLQKMATKLQTEKHKSKCSRAFGWIAAALTMVVAVVATAVTGGTAAPLLAVAALGVTMMALQQSGKMKDVVNGLASGLGKMMTAFGASKTEANKISKKMAIGLIATIVIVASIVGTALSGGAGGGSVAEAADDAMEMTEMGTDSAANAASDAGGSASESAGESIGESADEMAETSFSNPAELGEESNAFSDLNDGLNDSIEGLDQGESSEEAPIEESTSLEDTGKSAQNAGQSAARDTSSANDVTDAKTAGSLTRMQKVDKAIRMASMLMQTGTGIGKGTIDIQAAQAGAGATRDKADVVATTRTLDMIQANRNRLVPDMRRSEKYAASLESAISAILATTAGSENAIIQKMRI